MSVVTQRRRRMERRKTTVSGGRRGHGGGEGGGSGPQTLGAWQGDVIGDTEKTEGGENKDW